MSERLHSICAVVVTDDGLWFDLTQLRVRPIREEARYGGVRATFSARLGTAIIPVQIDFGVGDVITPAPLETEYPTLLGMESPVILAYPRETVVAEKLEAIVDRGLRNSRMKDYFDLWFIATNFENDMSVLRLATRRTFERRGQAFPTALPVGFTNEFAADPSKVKQWASFQRRTLNLDLSLAETVTVVREFATSIFFEYSGP